MTYQEILKTFGDPQPIDIGGGRVKLSDEWVKKNIAEFCFPILGKLFFNVKCYVQLFNALHCLKYYGLDDEIDLNLTKKIGGTWVCRRQMWDPKKPLSSHAFGIAIDIFSKKGGQKFIKNYWSEKFIHFFKINGFEWGGDYKNFYDPIHFEVNKILDIGHYTINPHMKGGDNSG